MKQFDKWNEVKKLVESRKNIINFKERDVFWTRIGENIGSEQNGKGDEFSRPVLVVKKLNKQLFFGVPLSTSIKQGSYFYQFSFIKDQISTALLVQAKVYDIKRVDTKLGMIYKDDFTTLKNKLKELMDL